MIAIRKYMWTHKNGRKIGETHEISLVLGKFKITNLSGLLVSSGRNQMALYKRDRRIVGLSVLMMFMLFLRQFMARPNVSM